MPDKDIFSNLPPPPEEDPRMKELHDLQATAWEEGILNEEFWRTAPYSDFAPDYLKKAAEEGRISRDKFTNTCQIIGESIYRSKEATSGDRHVLTRVFTDSGIENPEEKVEELIKNHLAEQFINPNN